MNTQLTIHSNQFHHDLKPGCTIIVDAPNYYDPKYAIKIVYRGRDLERFWGNSLQSGSLLNFTHQKIKVEK